MLLTDVGTRSRSPRSCSTRSCCLAPTATFPGILFRHCAFRASSLVSPAQLDSLAIHPGERELPLPLREDPAGARFFRRAVKTLIGYELSPTKPITYGMRPIRAILDSRLTL
jgi:hypothetical protein